MKYEEAVRPGDHDLAGQVTPPAAACGTGLDEVRQLATSASELKQPGSFGKEPDLAAAIARAVTQGKRAADDIGSNILAVSTTLRQAARSLAALDRQILDPASIARRCRAAIELADGDLQRTFHLRSAALGQVNLVLFGRTGAGKSSLIEALTHGDGESVSQGESDWTVDVRPVDWHSCRLFDTPGINGWGRTERRDDLEVKARRAVETADIVLLCFDTQSQQEGEFSKVAEWVQAYGKPAIAVLNNRNPEWRNPIRVRRRVQRANLTRTMLQHDDNVRNGLAMQGFADMPVVCLSAKRALSARARLPFLGPSAVAMASERKKYGIEELLRWSNLPALEDLLIDALTQDAPRIRVGMLAASLRGDLAQVELGLAAKAQEAQARAQTLDPSVERVLRLLGYRETAPSSPGEVEETDYLAWLERLRGGRFSVPSRGEFQEYVARILTSSLGAERAASLDRAEEFVIEAFNLKKPIDETVFAATVYEREKIEGAGRKVGQAAQAFLTAGLEIVEGDLKINMAALLASSTRIEGKSGSWWRAASTGANASTIALGVGTTLLAFTGVGIGVIAAAGVAASVVSLFTTWFGGHAARKAEAARATARRSTLADVRRAVNATFDGFSKAVEDSAMKHGQTAAAEVLVPLLRESIACHIVMQEIGKVRREIETVLSRLPSHERKTVLSDAAARIEARRYPADPNAGRLVWAGAEWVDDATGLDTSDVACPDGKPSERDDGETTPLWQLHADTRPVGEGCAFVTEAQTRLGDVASAASLLADLRDVAALDRPAICVVGDYNAGKTSFIKRMLADAGLSVGSDLSVRADPSTAKVTRYDWTGAWLVDTPGFQGLRQEDDLLAAEALSDTSVMIWLLNGNVLDGSIARLASVLKDSGKADRMLIVLGRSDELGRDPHDDPEDYSRTLHRKRLEIRQALRANEVEFPEARIFALAADPYGMVGDTLHPTARDYHANRGWDGVASFLAGLNALLAEDTGLSLVDTAVLNGALARLGRLDHELSNAEAALQPQLEQIQGLIALLATGIAEGGNLAAFIAAEVDRMLDETTQALQSEVQGARNAEELQEAAQRLAKWWEDSVFVGDVADWERRCRTEIDAWSTRITDLCARTVASRDFRSAFPESNLTYAADDLAPRKRNGPRWWTVVRSGVQSAASRKVVYDVGKFLGKSFRPWGAVKITGRFSKALPVVNIVAILFDGWSWWSSNAKNKKRDRARNDIARFINSSRKDVRRSLLEGGDEGRGVCHYLFDRIAALNELRTEITGEFQVCQKQLTVLSAERAALHNIMLDGRARLEVSIGRRSYV